MFSLCDELFELCQGPLTAPKELFDDDILVNLAEAALALSRIVQKAVGTNPYMRVQVLPSLTRALCVVSECRSWRSNGTEDVARAFVLRKESLEIARANPDDKYAQSTALFNLGHSHLVMKDYVNAFNLWCKAVTLRASVVGMDSEKCQLILKQMASLHSIMLGVTDLKAASSLRICTICGVYEKKLMKCSRCQLVYYCSEKCQHEDWKNHKRICFVDKEMMRKFIESGWKDQ